MPFAVASGALIIVIVILGLRRRTVFRIALRDFLRRPTQTVLLAAGLLVASLVMAAALVASDGIRGLFFENVYRSWGPVDVEVTTFTGSPFDESLAAVVLEDPRVIEASDGRALRMRIPTVTEAPEQQTRESRVNLIGIDGAADASLGPIDPSDTSAVAPGGDRTFINERLADRLGVEVGDPLVFVASPVGRTFTLELRVARIVPNEGKVDYERSANAFVDINTLRRASGLAGGNQILLSARGTAIEPANNPESRELIAAVSAAVARTAPPPNVPAQSLQLTLSNTRVEDIDQAAATSEFFRAVLGALGAVVALTSIALIVNLFVMLGEERRGELGTMRALGLRRSGLVLLGVSEGVLYSLAAAVVGTFVGALVGRYISGAVGGLIQSVIQTGEELAVPSVELRPDSLLAAGGLGFLISVAAVGFVSLRTSRLNVVSAIRGLPPERRSRRRRLPVLWVLALAGGGALLFLSSPVARAVGGALLAVGAGGIVGRFTSRRLGATLGGSATLGWGLWAHAYLDAGFDEDPNVAFTFFVIIGLTTVAAAVVLVSSNITIISSAARKLSTGARAIVQSAASYASGYRLRTALSMGMFALVIYMIAGFAVWGGLAGGDFSQQSGGFEVFARSTVPIDDLDAEGARVVSMYAARYEFGYTVGGQDSAQPIILYGIGPDFADLNRFGFSKKPRDTGDRQIWQRVLDEPLTVVLDANTTRAGVEVGDTLELKGDRGVFELRIAGIVDSVLFNAVYLSKQTFRSLYPTRAADTAWLMRLDEGTSPSEVAQGIEKRHSRTGIDGFPLEEVYEEVASFQRTFIGLFQILLKLGLVIGISSLAIGAVRVVLERRQAVGVMRALGFKRWMVAAWLMTEHVLIATLGVGVGLSVGLLGTYLVIANQVEELAFNVDWGQITSTLLIVYAAVVLFTILPAWRAARLPPAEAVRYVE